MEKGSKMSLLTFSPRGFRMWSKGIEAAPNCRPWKYFACFSLKGLDFPYIIL